MPEIQIGFACLAPGIVNAIFGLAQAKKHTAIMKAFTVRRQGQQTISVLLIVALANLSISCNYYKVKRTRQPAPPEATVLATQQGKYYILHIGNKAWHLSEISVSGDGETLNGSLGELPPEHLAYRKGEDRSVLRTRPRPPEPPRPANHHHRYKLSKEKPYYEVHIYTSQTVDSGNNKFTVPLSAINRIDVYDKAIGHTVASYVFGTLGVVAAVVVIIGIVALAMKSSCPFAYTKDAEGLWHFTGELYGGAIYAPLERDDYMPLPGLAVADGGASVKLTNELLERQYTNLANLVSVTHPAGTLALLDAAGNAHTVAAPQPPLPEDENSGKAAARDGRSLLFDEGNAEDGAVSSITLRFPKPAATTKGKLILRAKNSYWLDYAFGKFTESFGSYYNTFAAQQKREQAASQRAWSHAQHIPLSVAINTGSGWKEVAAIETIGPLAARDIVLPIDLREASGEGDIEVRLSCGYMFWEVDYAAMDYTPDAVTSVEEYVPAYATDETGADVRASLAAADGHYLAQLSPGTSATLRYTLSAAAAGTQQSFFLHSRGYYEYIRDYKNIPNVAQLISFKKDGAFTRFAKARYMQFAGKRDLFTTAFKPR